MENAAIESIAGAVLKLGPALTIILSLLAAIHVWYRSNSFHSISRWLWRFIGAKPKGNDAAFNEFMTSQDNLMGFRVSCGQARTFAQMHSIINWGRLHNESISDINACGPNFDREIPGL